MQSQLHVFPLCCQNSEFFVIKVIVESFFKPTVGHKTGVRSAGSRTFYNLFTSLLSNVLPSFECGLEPYSLCVFWVCLEMGMCIQTIKMKRGG